MLAPSQNKVINAARKADNRATSSRLPGNPRRPIRVGAFSNPGRFLFWG